MRNSKDSINKEILDFIKDYTDMNICGVIMNCPYWMNKLKAGQIRIRGFLEGKGGACQIQNELIKRLSSIRDKSGVTLTRIYLQKFAKRERIGIDCSGFVYRVLEKLVRLKYKGCQVSRLSAVFSGGVRKTNARRLTAPEYSIPIDRISDFQLGDMIRMRNGRHIAVILQVENSRIIYAHSSNGTKIQGVHLGTIKIAKADKSLQEQKWLEETKKGENFGNRYFSEENGDGIFRLKIFCTL